MLDNVNTITKTKYISPQYLLNGYDKIKELFDKYLFLEVINILIYIGLFKQSEIQLFKKYLKPV